VVSDGEYSFVFFRNVFAYAVHKKPPPGEYRSQPNFGAIHLTYTPTAREMAQVTAVLDAATRVCKEEGLNQTAPPLYARVDMARAQCSTANSAVDTHEEMVLMELELIEPHLYMPHDGTGGKRAAARFAEAVVESLAEAAANPSRTARLD
jgi:hypothetical protein